MNSDWRNDIVDIKRGESPLILGMPHTGTFVPPEIFERLNETGQRLSDTDWHVHTLYDGLIENVTCVRALFHRYVIDPNRDPSGRSLYPGQNTTALCPTTDFDNNPLYVKGQEPNQSEVQERQRVFHQQYHDALSAEIDRVRAKHGFAILYDCHSIRSQVPYLFEGKLPDFNIGTFGGKSCHERVAKSVLNVCASTDAYTNVLNGRFKGGWTTRNYGDPDNDVHAVQMELAQSIYMQEDASWDYLPERAEKVRPHLRAILKALSALELA